MQWVWDKSRGFSLPGLGQHIVSIPWTWKRDLDGKPSRSHEVTENQLSFSVIPTYFFNWPAMASPLSNDFPSLCPRSGSLNLSPPWKQENCSKLMAMWPRQHGVRVPILPEVLRGMWTRLNNRKGQNNSQRIPEITFGSTFKKLPSGCVWSKKSLQICMSTSKVKVSLTQSHTYKFVISRCLVRCLTLCVLSHTCQYLSTIFPLKTFPHFSMEIMLFS